MTQPLLINDKQDVMNVLSVFSLEPSPQKSISEMIDEARSIILGLQYPPAEHWKRWYASVARRSMGQVLNELDGSLANVLKWGCDSNSIAEMLVEKHKRYGPYAITRWGNTGVIIRIDSKHERLKNMMENRGLSDGTDESIIDTLKDIVGYCILGYIAIERSDQV